MTALTETADRQAKPPMHSGARMAPHLMDAISDAARQRGMIASAWLREAATTLARFEGTLPTIASRSACELYDRDTEGRQRWARIEDGEIKSITHSDAKPDDRTWVPVAHVQARHDIPSEESGPLAVSGASALATKVTRWKSLSPNWVQHSFLPISILRRSFAPITLPISWMKDDKRAIFAAASHAQRAADFLHGLQKTASAQANAA